MSSVQLQQIDQAFGDRKVLRGLDLRVDSGDYLVLLGASGCGKTTTLRIIAGLQTPDRGEVLLDGRRVNDMPPRLRDVAMVFQHDALYPHLTVGDSLRFALRGRLGGKEIESRVDEAARLAGIEGLLDRYPNRLSGGELRRSAVAKAIARRSRVRLLDEPLSALDAPVRHGLQEDLLHWHATAGGTTIHVTHDGQEAMRMADKIAVMDRGQVVQFATPTEIFARPQTIAVAQAIGSLPIQLFKGRAEAGKIELNNPDVHLGLPCPSLAGNVLVAVRPESFSIHSSTTDVEDALRVRGRLLRCDRMQRDLRLDVKCGSDSILVLAPIESHDTVSSRIGEWLELSAAPQDVHLFDADDASRIEAKRAD